MIHVRIGAEVYCSDGHYGTLDRLIADRTSRRITMLGVERKGWGTDLRLVPVDRVEEGSVERIVLDCTSAELAAMEPYSETTYRLSSASGAGATSPIVSADVRDNRPEDSKSLSQGMRVEADDGPVGTTYDLIVDSSTGEITHFSLVEGRLWRKKAITLPVSDVLRVADNTVYLKLNKQAISEMPAVSMAELDQQALKAQYTDVRERLARIEREWATAGHEAKTMLGHEIERLRAKAEDLRNQLRQV